MDKQGEPVPLEYLCGGTETGDASNACRHRLTRRFDAQNRPIKRNQLQCLRRELDLQVTKRLGYEIGGRPGYDVEPLESVLDMIVFRDSSEQVRFWERLGVLLG